MKRLAVALTLLLSSPAAAQWHGYRTPGVPRLGVPAIQSSDASMGITNPGYRPDDKGATAFPSLIALGSSFNPHLVRRGGEAIAREESRLLRLQDELTEVQARLAALTTVLRMPREAIDGSAAAPSTAIEKVALFRSRFRGREDL